MKMLNLIHRFFCALVSFFFCLQTFLESGKNSTAAQGPPTGGLQAVHMEKKMDEKKICAKVMAAKNIVEVRKYAGQLLTAVVAPDTLLDKIARLVANPEFINADSQISWLIAKAQAVVIEHITDNCKDPLTKVQVGFDLASLADMTVGDLVPEVKEIANE